MITNNSTLSQVGTSTFTGLITATGGIKNSSHLLMKADGAQSIYFTTDGNALGASNCVGRLFGASNMMYFDFYNNILFRSSTLADTGNNSALNINLTNSTFYGPLTTNNIINNGTLSQSGSASFNAASFTSITNNGILQTNNMELGPNGTTFSFLDMKTTGGNSDFDSRIGVTGGSSSSSGQGSLSFNCASCSIGSPLTVTGLLTTNNGITNNNNAITNNNTLNQVGTSTFTGLITSNNGITNNNNAITNNNTLNQVGTSTFTGLITSNGINCTSLLASGIVNITDTTQTTSESTGSLVVSGGVGITKNLNCKGNANFTNNLSCGTFSTTTITTVDLYSPGFNDSVYIRITGYTTKTSGVVTHYWKSSYSPSTSNVTNNFVYRLPDSCISMCSQYNFYKTGGSSGASQGITPYYYMKIGNNTWNENIATTIGNYYHQPTGSNCTYDYGTGFSFYGAYFNVPSK